MKVFVAGATGTLGLPLVQALIARNHAVVGLTRSAEKKSLLERAGAIPALADALDEPTLTQAVRLAAPDCIVHLLTALPKNSPTSTAEMAETNRLRVRGTANLLAAALAAGTPRIVAESMVFVYGFGDHGPRKLVETDISLRREVDAGLQEVVDALRSLEEQLLAAGWQGQVQASLLRFGLLYGAGTPSTAAMLDMIRQGRVTTASGTRGCLPWIHIQDAVTAMVAAVERDRAGEVYNIVDDEPVSMNAWVCEAAQVLGATPPRSIPLSELSSSLPLVGAIYDTYLPVSNARAKQELGWQLKFPTPWEGIRSFVYPETSLS